MLKRPEAPAAPATAVTAPGGVTAAGGKRRKPGRNKRRPGQGGREERGGAAATALAPDASALQKFRAWCRGRREGLREWWAEVLKNAQKKG
jgi:hypothetical protein